MKLLHPLQFITDHMTDNSIGRPPEPKYPIGAQVHNENGKPGIVTAHHVDYRHYNVRWGRSNDTVEHEDNLR